MILTVIKETKTTKKLVLAKLQENQRPISIQNLEDYLKSNHSLSHRLVKEATWELVEEGKARFTSSWELEINF